MPESFPSHAPHLLCSGELHLHFQSSTFTCLVLHDWLYFPVFYPQSHMRTNFVIYHDPKPKMFKGQRNATSCIYMPGVLWRNTSGSSRGWTPSDRCQAKSDQGDLMLQLKSTCGCPVQPEKIPLFTWPTILG